MIVRSAQRSPTGAETLRALPASMEPDSIDAGTDDLREFPAVSGRLWRTESTVVISA